MAAIFLAGAPAVAAEPVNAAAAGRAFSALAIGPSFASGDSLEVVRPVRAIFSLDVARDRLFLDLDLAAWLAAVNRKGASRSTWKMSGDLAPVAAAAFWMLGAQSLLEEGSLASRIVAAPAVVAAASIVQPRLRWRLAGPVSLAAGWGSEWHLFHPEKGLSWRPGLGAAVHPTRAFRLEGGVERHFFWSFDAASRDWGWGWHAGLGFEMDLE